MSKKYALKRIALVAVSALGFGLMSVVPASASVPTSLTSATLSLSAGSSSPDFQLVATGSTGTRASGFTLFTNQPAVDLDGLTIDMVAETGATDDVFAVTVSLDNTATAGTIDNLRHGVVATTAAFSGVGAGKTAARVVPELGTGDSGTPTGITTGSATLATGATYYIYLQKTRSATYTAAADLKIALTLTSTTVSPVTATLGANTTVAGRVNNLVTVPISATTAIHAGSTGVTPQLRIAAAMSAQPADSSVQPVLTAGSANIATTLTRFNTTLSSLSFGSGVKLILGSVARDSTATSVSPASVAYYAVNSGAAVAAQTTAISLATLTFTPTVVGTYKVTVWNESNTSASASLSGTESFQTFTINVSAGVSTIALTPVNSTSVEDATYGSLVKVAITDAAGNAAALGAGESISIDPTGTGTVAYYSVGTGSATFTGGNTATSATAGAAYSLSASNFVGGVAFVNITDATAETVSLVASLSSNSSVTASTSLLFRSKTETAITLEPSALAAGWAGSADTYTTPLVSSITYATAGGVATGSTSTLYGGFTVEDNTGALSGLKYGRYDVAVNSVVGSTVTIGGTFAAAGAVYTMSDVADTGGNTSSAFASTPNVITAAAIDPAVTPNALVDDTVAFDNSALRIAPAGTVSFILTISDQFARALPNATVTLTWSGRNTSTAATQKVGFTDANGQITLSYTDTALSTATATADTVTATAVYGSASSTSTATVTWIATTVGTLTLTSTGDTDVIAGTTTTDISAGVAGATATSATASALVKDANGVIIVGTPVTFTVTGLVGAEVHTTKATVYTDSTGTAVSNISSYAAGKATVTATAGTVTATDDVYFKQATATEARTISAAVSGGTVTATVKDRYGNTIEGVTVNATRTGTGFFGSGASTSTGTTDENGVVEFIVSGDATVTVAFTSATYGQSAAVEGSTGTTAATAIDAYVAGTASANQEGLGGSLAPAGVNSASVTVSAPNAGAVAAEAAADAAAEAIDAANAATDAANLAAEAADAATVAAEEARDAADAATAAVEELATQVATLMAALKAQITTLANTVAKIAKKVKA